MMQSDLLDSLLSPGNADGRCYGVVVGIVTNNRDPENMHRVKLRFPWLTASDESNWARVASVMAGNGRGAYFLPEIDDEVLVVFEHGIVEQPFVIGSLWNGKDAPHESNNDGKNDNRSIRSRSGHLVRLCDRAGEEKIEIIDKTGNNRIVISASDDRITIEAQGDIGIRSQTGKLTLEAVGVEIRSRAGVTVQATTTVDVSATGQMSLKGAMINWN